MEFPSYDSSAQWPQWQAEHRPLNTMPDADFRWDLKDLNTPRPETPYIPLLSMALGYPGTIPNIAAPAGTPDTIEDLPTFPPTSTATSSDEGLERAPHRHTQQRSKPASKAQKHRRLNEAQRINTLLVDEYVLSFTPTEVTCGGCLTTIQLERRNNARYYVGRWTRHRESCRGVREGMVSHQVLVPRSVELTVLLLVRLLHADGKLWQGWRCSLE